MAGQSFSLICSLTGGASLQLTLSYQWTREGGSLMTSTATLNFDTLYLSDAGQYSCQVILTSSQLERGYTVAAHYTIEFMSKWLLFSKACWFNFTFIECKQQSCFIYMHVISHVISQCLYTYYSSCLLLMPTTPHSTGLHIQLRLGEITNCRVYTELDADVKTNDITNRLKQGIESQCACGFNSSLILNSFFVCFDVSPSHVTYRAVLTGSESVSTIQLARLMKQWIENDPIVVVQRAGLSVTNSCPVVIANLNSPKCPEDITNQTQVATPTSSIATPTSSIATTSPTQSVVVNVGAVAGGVVAGVLAIAVLVLIVIVLVMLRQWRSGSQDMSNERTDSQPTE